MSSNRPVIAGQKMWMRAPRSSKNPTMPRRPLASMAGILAGPLAGKRSRVRGNGESRSGLARLHQCKAPATAMLAGTHTSLAIAWTRSRLRINHSANE